MRKLPALVVLVTLALLMLVQFGPPAVFGGEAGSTNVRAGAR